MAKWPLGAAVERNSAAAVVRAKLSLSLPHHWPFVLSVL